MRFEMKGHIKDDPDCPECYLIVYEDYHFEPFLCYQVHCNGLVHYKLTGEALVDIEEDLWRAICDVACDACNWEEVDEFKKTIAPAKRKIRKKHGEQAQRPRDDPNESARRKPSTKQKSGSSGKQRKQSKSR